MTAKQILDAFSETLMQDERILSPRERELLMSLLQNSRAVSSSNPEIQSAVTAAIARSVGETVAQRAFALLGGSIVEQILASSGIPAGTEETMPAISGHTSPDLRARRNPRARRNRQACVDRRCQVHRSPRERRNRPVHINTRERRYRPAALSGR